MGEAGTTAAGMATMSHSSGWKGKGSSKGYRGWQTPWNSQQSSGSWQEPNRTQWSAPPAKSPPSWFSATFASTIESAYVGAVREQTERTTSSWISGALLDTFTNVVRQAVTPLNGGQPIAETPRKPELPKGDARVTRQLTDELKKETASIRRTCDEKMKRTRGWLTGLPHPAVKAT